mgnify:CR=1 FL=1
MRMWIWFAIPWTTSSWQSTQDIPEEASSADWAATGLHSWVVDLDPATLGELRTPATPEPTLDEIAAWGGSSDNARRRILAQAEQRKTRPGTI